MNQNSKFIHASLKYVYNLFQHVHCSNPSFLKFIHDSKGLVSGDYSPWATNNPYPPGGIFEGMIFWKFMKNATK